MLYFIFRKNRIEITPYFVAQNRIKYNQLRICVLQFLRPFFWGRIGGAGGGGISLHAREISFIHPVSKELINITTPVPDERLWKEFGRGFLKSLSLRA